MLLTASQWVPGSVLFSAFTSVFPLLPSLPPTPLPPGSSRDVISRRRNSRSSRSLSSRVLKSSDMACEWRLEASGTGARRGLGRKQRRPRRPLSPSISCLDVEDGDSFSLAQKGTAGGNAAASQLALLVMVLAPAGPPSGQPWCLSSCRSFSSHTAGALGSWEWGVREAVSIGHLLVLGV